MVTVMMVVMMMVMMHFLEYQLTLIISTTTLKAWSA